MTARYTWNHVLRSWLPKAAAVAAILTAPALATDASAANLYARINSNGTTAAGSGVTGSAQLGVGQYEVTFNTNVSQCAYLATTVNGGVQAIQAYTAGGHLSANGVFVETKNQGGGLSSGAFNLVVICGGLTKTSFAVVDYGGTLVRSTPGTSVVAIGIGRYRVTFAATVKKCTYLATVADPGNALVFNPSGVYVANDALATSVVVETKNPGGGLQFGVPFHLAAICSGAKSMHHAVLDSGGLMNRGSLLTGTYRGAVGKYVLVASKSLASCATVATRGSINTAVPFTPTTVETIAGPAANTVGIEQRDLLFFGGALKDEAFHVASVCP